MKILLIYASAGAGHMRAAEAVYNGIKTSSEHEIFFVDALDYCLPIFRQLYQKIYCSLVSQINWLWGWIFNFTDKNSLQPIIKLIKRGYNLLTAPALHRFLQEEKFDYIISTHFMPMEISAALKEKGLINSKIITIITDFDVHRIWVNKGVDIYAVACDWTKQKLISLGIEEDKIVVTGVPTDERFSACPDVVELKKKLGLKLDVFTVLIATGTFGVGPIEELVEALKGFQIIVICGKNETLYHRLREKRYELVNVHALVDNMHELMAVSDAIITKPGGLTISEALVSQLPLIFFNPIPGQETNNIKVLKRYGIGINGGSVQDIVNELQKMNSSRDIYLSTVNKSRNLARPFAVKDILSLIK